MRTRITVTFTDGSGWRLTQLDTENALDGSAEWLDEDFNTSGDIVATYTISKRRVDRYITSVTTEALTVASIIVERVA